MNEEGKSYLYKELSKAGLDFIPTMANFILINLGRNGDEVFKKMLEKGIIVRPLRGYKFPASIRVTIGLTHENRKFIKALLEVLKR